MKTDKLDVSNDIVFEMELVKQIEVNVDYILNLIKEYHDGNMENKELLITINRMVMSSPDLRNKVDLIDEFIRSLNKDSNVYNDFNSFMNSKKKEELDKIISEENLDKEKTYVFVKRSFENGRVETNGTELSFILPAMSRFEADKKRTKKKESVVEKLIGFFDKFFSISNSEF